MKLTKNKLVGLLSVSFLLLFAISLILAIVPLRKTSAASVSDFNVLDVNGVKLTVIDRMHIQVSFPTTPLFKGGADNSTFQDVFGGIYTEGAKDLIWRYDFKSTTFPSSAFVDTFNSSDLYDATGSPAKHPLRYDVAMTPAQLTDYTKDIELTLVYAVGADNYVFTKDNKWVKLDFGTFGNDPKDISAPKVASRIVGLQNFNITYYFDGTQITNINDSKDNYVPCANNTFANVSCAIGVGNDSKFIDGLPAQLQGTGTVAMKLHDGDNIYDIVVAQKDNASVGGLLSPTGDSTNPDFPACEIKIRNPLTWLICPVVTVAVEGIRQFDNAITSQLTVPGQYFDESQTCVVSDGRPCPAGYSVYSAWASFRAIAVVLLIFVALIMVIGQAIAGGLFDAYTVKKIMPRLLIAIIGITFSWNICKLLIDFSNAAGLGTKDLVLAPFHSSDTGALFKDSAVLTSILQVGILGLAGFALGIGGLLAFAATGFVAVLIAFVLVVVRQIVIIGLVIAAPIGIVAFILPNTHKLWKLWWESFSKLLLVFPLIMGFIALGRAFALLSNDYATKNGTLNSTVAHAITFIAYFGPYFAIPKLFAAAGSLFGNITGAVNNRGKGAFDRLRNYRGAKSKENFAKGKAGTRFNERGGLIGKATGRFNKMTRGVGTGPRGGFGLSARGRGAVDQIVNTAAQEKMRDQGFAQQMFDDDIRLVHMEGNADDGAAALTAKKNAKIDQDEADRKISADQAAAKRLGVAAEVTRAVGAARNNGFNASTQLAAFNAEAANKGRNFKNAAVAKKYLEKVSASTGADMGRLKDSFSFNAKNAGRTDLADLDADPNKAWSKTTMGLLGNSTGTAIDNFISSDLSILQNATDDDPISNAARTESAVRLLEMHNLLPYTTEENQTIIRQKMEQVGVRYDGTESIENQLAKLANSKIEYRDAAGNVTSSVDLSGNALRQRARVYDGMSDAERLEALRQRGQTGTTNPGGTL